MDSQTVAVYDNLTRTFVQEWCDQPVPGNLYALLRREFKAGDAAADIGRGAGREVAWLGTDGYPVVGYNMSAALLETTREQYPGLSFRQAFLPKLIGIAEGAFDDVFCETAIVHLSPGQIGAVVQQLVPLLRPDGMLYLSWRVTPGADRRNGCGRLFASFDVTPVCEALAGAEVVFDEAAVS